MIDIILFLVTMVALIFATVFDVKTKEIPNWLTYSFITLALTANLIYSVIISDYSFILRSILGFLLFFIIGNIMYFSQQWGGGDAKLAMGLGAAFYTYPNLLLDLFDPNLTIPFVITIFINILIVGAGYSISWSAYLIIKNYKEFRASLKNKLKETKYIQAPVFVFAVILLALSFIMEFKLIGIISSLLLISLMYLLIAVKTIDKICMYKTVAISKLTEGDWIPQSVYHKGKLIIKSKAEGITKEDMALLKKLKIKKILIREGIPFVPSILLGVIISLIFGFIIPI